LFWSNRGNSECPLLSEGSGCCFSEKVVKFFAIAKRQIGRSEEVQKVTPFSHQDVAQLKIIQIRKSFF
jgi:hypothetical protein